VAMGRRGTDVAKEAADVVLQDDHFATITPAIEQGRVVFDNISKCVFYLFSCNLAEVLVLLIGAAGTLELPLLPLQILWLNLVTDTFPALALALEPGEPDVMRRPPRDPGAELFSRAFLREMVLAATVISVATLAAFAIGRAGAAGSAQRAVTMSFMTLAIAQAFHLGNARSRVRVLSPRAAFGNPWAVAAVLLVIALQLAAVHYAPLARVLATAPLVWLDWLAILVLAALPGIVGQAFKPPAPLRSPTPAMG
jgi:Ca2+-transporting ATPase